MNKYLKIALIIIVVLIVLAIAFSTGNNNENTSSTKDVDLSETAEEIIANAQNESSLVKDSEKKEFTQIDVNTYLEYYNGNEQKIILLARPTCPYCQIAEPIIQNVAYEYNIDINYLDTDKFKEADQKEFINSDEVFKEGYGTPYLFIVSNGGIIDSVDGLTDKAHYIEFFKANGYIS